MTIPGFDGLVVRLASRCRKKRDSPIFRVSRNPFRVNGRMFYRAKDETTRAAPLSAAPDADLLCGPVKHLYQLTRGELTACPVAVGIAKRKLAGPGTRSAIGTLIRSDRYAECSVPRESVPRRSHPRAKVPHLNKPFDILSPSINKTTRWLIITRHSDTLRRSQNSREMRNSPRLSFRITFNYRFLEWTDRDYDREFSSCN